MDFLTAMNDFLGWEKHRRAEKTVAYNRTHLSNLGMFLWGRYGVGGGQLESLTRKDLVDYLDASWAIQQANSLQVARSGTARKLFRFYEREGLTVLNPENIPLPRIERAPPKRITKEDFVKLMAGIEANSHTYKRVRNRAMILLYRESGLRRSELVSVKVMDIDVERKRGVTKTAKKRNKVTQRPFFWHTEECSEAVRAWLDYRAQFVKDANQEALFVTRNDLGLAPGAVNQFISDACRRAGIPNINPHSLRHLFAIEMAEAGMQQSELASIMGHEHIESSYVYTRLWGKDIEDAYRRHHVDKLALANSGRLKYNVVKQGIIDVPYADDFGIQTKTARSQTKGRIRHVQEGKHELRGSRQGLRNEQNLGARSNSKVFHS